MWIYILPLQRQDGGAPTTSRSGRVHARCAAAQERFLPHGAGEDGLGGTRALPRPQPYRHGSIRDRVVSVWPRVGCVALKRSRARFAIFVFPLFPSKLALPFLFSFIIYRPFLPSHSHVHSSFPPSFSLPSLASPHSYPQRCLRYGEECSGGTEKTGQTFPDSCACQTDVPRVQVPPTHEA